MNDDFGGNTVIRSNLFFKSLLETSDHGVCFNELEMCSFMQIIYANSFMICRPLQFLVRITSLEINLCDLIHIIELIDRTIHYKDILYKYVEYECSHCLG